MMNKPLALFMANTHLHLCIKATCTCTLTAYYKDPNLTCSEVVKCCEVSTNRSYKEQVPLPLAVRANTLQNEGKCFTGRCRLDYGQSFAVFVQWWSCFETVSIWIIWWYAIWRIGLLFRTVVWDLRESFVGLDFGHLRVSKESREKNILSEQLTEFFSKFKIIKLFYFNI